MVNWFTLSMVYILAWWMVFFMALPFGAAPPERIEKGHSSGAPAKTHLGMKALASTVLAAVLTAIFFFATSGILVAP